MIILLTLKIPIYRTTEAVRDILTCVYHIMHKMGIPCPYNSKNSLYIQLYIHQKAERGSHLRSVPGRSIRIYLI